LVANDKLASESFPYYTVDLKDTWTVVDDHPEVTNHHLLRFDNVDIIAEAQSSM
jgi:hypothetical protein